MLHRNVRFAVLATAAIATLGILVTPAFAEPGHPSAKATAALSSTHLFNSVTAAEGGWTQLLSNTIKTPNGKCLVVTTSLECGLYTQTQVSSKGGKKDTSTAEASMLVKVTVDGQDAHPGEVVFARRMQQMSATLEGMIADCLTVADNGVDIILDESCVTPEEVELVTETMNAASFTFSTNPLNSGVHTVKVFCKMKKDSSAQEGSASAWGLAGKGCMSVETARFIQGEDVIELE